RLVAAIHPRGRGHEGEADPGGTRQTERRGPSRRGTPEVLPGPTREPTGHDGLAGESDDRRPTRVPLLQRVRGQGESRRGTDAGQGEGAEGPNDTEEQPMNTCKTLWLAMIVAIALVGCNDGGNQAKNAGDKEYDIRGKVMAVDPTKPTVTLNH